MPEFAFIKEGTGGKDRLDFCGGNRAYSAFNPGGVVHHRRNTPAGNGAKMTAALMPASWVTSGRFFHPERCIFPGCAPQEGFGQQLAIGIG